jgi:hypothetical protein
MYMPRLIGAAAAPALALLLAACGGSAAPPSAASTSSPPSAEATAAADPCEALIAWRDGSGATSLRKVARALGAVSSDELNGDVASISGDGQKLYTAATAAQDNPPPIGKAKYLKAMKLAAKAAVFAQSGNYQASSDAVTESGDLFSTMTSDVTGQCG